MIEFTTTSPAQTTALGSRLARAFRADDVAGFFGELGSGKTTLIKGICAGLGVNEVVKSPSFVLITTYPGTIPIHHVDLYRLAGPAEVAAIGLDELFGTGLVLIEWADRATGMLPADAVRIELAGLDALTRRIRITGTDLEERLAAARD